MAVPQNRELAGGAHFREFAIVDVVFDARKAEIGLAKELIARGLCGNNPPAHRKLA
jgi:hypothetical protein